MAPDFVPALSNVDIDAWLGVEPEYFRLDPALTAELDPLSIGCAQPMYCWN